VRALLIPPSRARAWLGVAVGLAGPVLAAPLVSNSLTRRYPVMYYLLIVVVAAGIGRLLAGALAVVVSAIVLEVVFLEPTRRFTFGADAIVVGAFLVIGFTIAHLIASVERGRDRAEADAREQAAESARMAILARTGEAISGSIEYRDTLVRLSRALLPDLADWFAVHLVDRHTGAIELVHVDHLDPEKVAQAHRLWDELPPPDPEGPTGLPHAIRTGEAALIAEVTEEMVRASLEATNPELIPFLLELQLRSVMIVPLRAHGEVFGALQFVAAESGRRYTAEDLALAEEIAERAGIAIDNALLYRERDETARALQRRLLPKVLPHIPGLTCAARYLPAEGSEAGGDFYDLFEIGDGNWKAVVGDVCGKGPEAAALMGFVRFTARAVSRQDARPSEALTKLNRAIKEEIGGDATNFCTAAVVRIHPHPPGVRLTVAIAGHPLPFVVRSTGEVERAGVPGTLLGILDEIEVTDTVVELATGDSLIMVTDGALEASPDPDWEDNAFPMLVASSAGLDPETVGDLLEASVTGVERRRPDDLAILVICAPPGVPDDPLAHVPRLLVADAEMRYVDANAMILADLGYEHDELLRLRVDDLVVAPSDVTRAYRDYLQEGAWEGETTLRTKDGGERTYRAQASILQARRGPLHLSSLTATRQASRPQALSSIRNQPEG
jgi:serine phosphatase RsbU (regulator of sigma subunit)